MIEKEKLNLIRESVKKLLQYHQEDVKQQLQRLGQKAKSEDLLVLIVKEGHTRDMEVGKFICRWGGEGETSIIYRGGKEEMFGGELKRGGIEDEEVFTIYRPLISQKERVVFELMPGFLELSRK